MKQRWALDLYCKAGGASVGYAMAGFQVVGVDVEPQSRYPFEFIQDDALAFLDRYGHLFDVITGSPPCRDHTSLTSRAGKVGNGWMLGAFRERLLQQTGRPWVIENVPGAPMRKDAVLCGGMFGLRTYRHRWFESNVPLVAPSHPKHVVRTSTKKRRTDWEAGMHVSVTGDIGTYIGSEAMGINWMTGDELSQAIPPLYTEWIGHQLLTYLVR